MSSPRISGDTTRALMAELAKHIEGTLKERGFCVVFEDELELSWPSEEIQACRPRGTD
jgi:hypothetical protein